MTTFAPYPLVVLAGALAAQVCGWITDRRLFESTNAEAMVFVVCAGYIAFMAWFSKKADESDVDVVSYSARTIWMCGVLLGAGLGVAFQLMRH